MKEHLEQICNYYRCISHYQVIRTVMGFINEMKRKEA